jgi:DNA-binding NtrC family response regulator
MAKFKHILILENDARICGLLGMALRDCCCRVSLASDGIAARVALRGSKVDLILADVLMPGETGLQLAEHAKTLGVPSLLMSGERATIEALKDNHAFIGKPLMLRELTEHIMRVLAKPKGDTCTVLRHDPFTGSTAFSSADGP